MQRGFDVLLVDPVWREDWLARMTFLIILVIDKLADCSFLAFTRYAVAVVNCPSCDT
jgi:hypothetical protein